MKKNITFKQKASRAERVSVWLDAFSNFFFAGVFIFLIVAFVGGYFRSRYFLYYYLACMLCGVLMMVLRYLSFLLSNRANKFWCMQIKEKENALSESFARFSEELNKNVSP